MSVIRSPFTVMVLGRVVVRDGDGRVRGLGEQPAGLLAALVAAGSIGIEAADLDPESSAASSPAALRMAIARLRKRLPDGALPSAAGHRYALTLPPHAVDAWQLLELAGGPLPDGLEADRVVQLVEPGPPYGRVAETALIQQSTYVLRRAQHQLLGRLATERPQLLRGDVLAALRVHNELAPTNEQLIGATAVALAGSGNRREAIRTIARARREFASAGLTIGPDLAAIEASLLDGSIELAAPSDARDVATQFPLPLRDQLLHRFHGPTALIETVLDHVSRIDRKVSTAVVTGPSGVGKSRLCAEVGARAASAGVKVVYAVPSGSVDDAAFGCLLAAVPRVRSELDRIRGLALDPESRHAEQRLSILDALLQEADGRPMLLVFDDVQWLDSRSIDLVQFIASMAPEFRLGMLVSGRADGRMAPWMALRSALEAHGALSVEVPPLSEDLVLQMVRDQHRELHERELRALARQVANLSNGLPGVARHLTALVDPASRQMPRPEQLASTGALGAVVDRLSPTARDVGVVASVIGPSFEFSALADLTGLDEDRLLDGLDELLDHRLVTERSAGSFSLVHVLVQSAFLRSTVQARAAAIHRRAALRAAGDVHRRAYHEASAVPLVDAETARASLIESAVCYLSDGLSREAVETFRRATELVPGPLPSVAAGSFARALDLEGSRADAAVVREHAVSAALAAGDHPCALAAAVSGLPEAEPIDGDTAIIDLLVRIDPQRLDPSQQWDLAVQLARQFAIVGRGSEALAAARQAHERAVSPLQRARSAITSRFVMSASTTPAERLAMLDKVHDDIAVLGTAEVAELHLLRALDSYECGSLVASSAAAASLAAMDDELGAVRRWHTLLLRAMLATEQGSMTEARALRVRAYEYGMACGLVEHANAYAATEFGDLWLRGHAASLRDSIGSGLLDPQRSLLTRAGSAAVLAAAGELEQALILAESVATKVLAHPSGYGSAALALISDVLTRGADEALVEAARSQLAARGKSMIVLGAGVASFGPASRYVAQLTTDADERRSLLADTERFADGSGALLWRAIARRDRALWLHDDGARRELADLVHHTELADLAL